MHQDIYIETKIVITHFTDFLSAKYHSRGIMSAAVATLLRDWAIPKMNARRMTVCTFTENVASVRVFEKNGFKKLMNIEEWKVVKGRMRGINILEWKHA